MNAIQILARQFSLNTRLFRNVLQGISEEDSIVQINDKIPHLRWIAGHLVVTRYRNIARLGLKTDPYPHMEAFIIKDMPPPNARPMDLNTAYPALKETLGYWEKYSADLLNQLPALPGEQLLAEGSVSTPIGGNTLLEVYAFLAEHEAYHIGQMSIIRKSLGYKAMSYS